MQIDELLQIARERGVVALTGAGISTPSGIPDYRGSDNRLPRRAPIQYREFRDSEKLRRRYWARSAIGWPWINARSPNAAHHALARLEREGYLDCVITQNVDSLHQRAGSANVVELHGSLREVNCMSCGSRENRRAFQDRIVELNPQWRELTAQIAPDGDAELPREIESGFLVPSCSSCGGVLKPDVVFFGENVPRERVGSAVAKVEAARSLLVLGSTLTVFSGFRFVKQAAAAGTRIAIINRGPTRGDTLATVVIDGSLEALLPQIADKLAPID